MEQFSTSEIQVDTDGWPYFVDGWGTPILFLRWAPGFSSGLTTFLAAAGYANLGYTGPSDIQSGDGTNDHDPFDTRNLENGLAGTHNAFHLIPLIYSSHGMTNASCVFVGGGGGAYQYAGDPFQAFYDATSGKNLLLGTPTSGAIVGIIHNHHIEAR
jgi:hypothetical protein